MLNQDTEKRKSPIFAILVLEVSTKQKSLWQRFPTPPQHLLHLYFASYFHIKPKMFSEQFDALKNV